MDRVAGHRANAPWRLGLPPLMYGGLAVLLSVGAVVIVDVEERLLVLLAALTIGVAVGLVKTVRWWVGPFHRMLQVDGELLIVRHKAKAEVEVRTADIVHARFDDCLLLMGVIVPGHGSDAPRLHLALRDGTVVKSKPFIFWDQVELDALEQTVRRAARTARGQAPENR